MENDLAHLAWHTPQCDCNHGVTCFCAAAVRFELQAYVDAIAAEQKHSAELQGACEALAKVNAHYLEENRRLRRRDGVLLVTDPDAEKLEAALRGLVEVIESTEWLAFSAEDRGKLELARKLLESRKKQVVEYRVVSKDPPRSGQ